MIPAATPSGYLGWSVSTAGDINGDNLTDLVLGAPDANADKGTAYVIFGNRGGFSSSFNLNTLNGTNGFIVPGVTPSGHLGWSVSTAGDINGDNLTDLVLGAYGVTSNSGAAYVIFGSRGKFTASFSLNTLNGTNGFTVPGIASSGRLGVSVRTAGDINGDNITDLILEAPNANANKGTAYVIFGSRGKFTSSFSLSTLNGANGFTVPGIGLDDWLGVSVNTAGDINGDNITDLSLGAWNAGAGNGTAYVIFGSRGKFTSSFSLSTLNGTNGFTIPGVASHGLLGYSVSTAGDVNDDNIMDLVLGAHGANANNNGMVYVIFGSRDGFSSSFNLNTLNGTNGFTVPGVTSGGQLGVSVSMAGDVNGDNIMDLVLGADYANSGNGAAYIIFGQNSVVIPPTTPISTPLTPSVIVFIALGSLLFTSALAFAIWSHERRIRQIFKCCEYNPIHHNTDDNSNSSELGISGFSGNDSSIEEKARKFSYDMKFYGSKENAGKESKPINENPPKRYEQYANKNNTSFHAGSSGVPDQILSLDITDSEEPDISSGSNKQDKVITTATATTMKNFHRSPISQPVTKESRSFRNSEDFSASLPSAAQLLNSEEETQISEEQKLNCKNW